MVTSVGSEIIAVVCCFLLCMCHFPPAATTVRCAEKEKQIEHYIFPLSSAPMRAANEASASSYAQAARKEKETQVLSEPTPPGESSFWGTRERATDGLALASTPPKHLTRRALLSGTRSGGAE